MKFNYVKGNTQTISSVNNYFKLYIFADQIRKNILVPCPHLDAGAWNILVL
jgi:hypothetical protein